jgi:hypothetical protein
MESNDDLYVTGGFTFSSDGAHMSTASTATVASMETVTIAFSVPPNEALHPPATAEPYGVVGDGGMLIAAAGCVAAAEFVRARVFRTTWTPTEADPLRPHSRFLL